MKTSCSINEIGKVIHSFAYRVHTHELGTCYIMLGSHFIHILKIYRVSAPMNEHTSTIQSSSNDTIDIFGIPGFLKFIFHSLNNSVQEYYNIYFKLVINK